MLHTALHLKFDSGGNGGTIIDLESSISSFPEPMYKQIEDEFVSKIGHGRASEVEVDRGFGLCYNVSVLGNIRFPEFAFHFKGGSNMVALLSMELL